MAELQRGVVKWFNDAKGFGFIEHETGKDVFIHYSVIESEGYKTLKDGEEVEYELADGDKGLHAAKVVRIHHPKDKEKKTSEAVAPNLENGSVASVSKPLTQSMEVEAEAKGTTIADAVAAESATSNIENNR